MSNIKQLRICDVSIDLIRKDIKNMRLVVYPFTGRVRVSAPFRVSDAMVHSFIDSKISWIKNSQKKAKEQQKERKKLFVDGEEHYFFGQKYLLDLVEKKAAPEVLLKNRAHISLYIRPNSTPEKKQSIINEWYRSELKLVIPSIIEKYENKLNVKTNEWHIKRMKTRWGSCNIKAKRIWVNLELAKKPIICLEYVILHELIHLIERYHNDNFKTHLKKHMPQWRFLEKELARLDHASFCLPD